jgi:hypothetical protein
MDLARKVREESEALSGVFLYSDFFNMLPVLSKRKVQRWIVRLIEEGVITKVKKEIYVTKNPDLWVLAARLSPGGYISMDNVLSKNGLIGTIPARRVFILSSLAKRIYETPAGLIYALQIKKDLMFGFNLQKKRNSSSR